MCLGGWQVRSAVLGMGSVNVILTETIGIDAMQGAASSRHSSILACDTQGGLGCGDRRVAHTLSRAIQGLAQIRGLRANSAVSLRFTSCSTGAQHGFHGGELACSCNNIPDGVDVSTRGVTYAPPRNVSHPAIARFCACRISVDKPSLQWKARRMHAHIIRTGDCTSANQQPEFLYMRFLNQFPPGS